MRLFFSLLLVLTSDRLTSGSRIIDRFPGSRWPVFARCRIGHSYQAHRFSSHLLVDYSSSMIQRFEAMNCSLVLTEFTEIGSLDSHGNYSGEIGIVQRDEVDIKLIFYRSDSFAVVAGYVVWIGMSADEVIISKQNKTTTIRVPLLQLWTSQFDDLTLYSVLLSVSVFVVVLTIATAMTIAADRIITRILGNFFNAFSAAVDQENFTPLTTPAMIAVWFYNLFLLFFVHGLVLGSLGADLIVDIKPPIVESMYEFTPDSFMQPVVPKQVLLMNYLKTTRDPELIHLRGMIAVRPENAIEIDIQNLGSASSLLLDVTVGVRDSRRAVIFPKSIIAMSRGIACSVAPDLVKDLDLSRRSFAPGLLVTLLSLKIDPLLRQVFVYHIRTFAETDQWTGVQRFISRSNEFAAMIGKSSAYGVKNMECEAGPVGSTEHELLDFDMTTFHGLFTGLFVGLAFSGVILCGKLLLKGSKDMLKSWKNWMNPLNRTRLRQTRRRRIAPEDPATAAGPSNLDLEANAVTQETSDVTTRGQEGLPLEQTRSIWHIMPRRQERDHRTTAKTRPPMAQETGNLQLLT